MTESDTKTPGSISPNDVGDDLLEPTVEVLRKIQLLPKEDETQEGFWSAFQGPPASVALLKAGLTSGAKWWSAGGAAVVVAIWGAVKVFWAGNLGVHRELIWAATITSTAILVGIAWLLTADVRGRVVIQAAVIAARASVVKVMLELGEGESSRKQAAKAKELASDGTVIPFPFGSRAKYKKNPDDADVDWLPVVSRSSNGSDGVAHDEYFLVHGHEHIWAPADQVSIWY